jgi:hypothetical protein
MATLKYKDPSPYANGPQVAPRVDYLYARWANISVEFYTFI